MVNKESPTHTRTGATNDIITIIRDPNKPLGKRFSLNQTTGVVTKDSAVTVAYGIAVQRHAPDVASLRDVLQEISDDSHAAIINACFPLIPIGEDFLVLSESRFQRNGIKRHDPEQVWPAPISYNGKVMPALGRFKEHVSPSSWVLLDRDIDEHTPERFAKMSYDEWLAAVDMLLPGILSCARVRVQSSSARVFKGGEAQGAGNGHTWIQVGNPSDIERMRKAIPARAIELGLAWSKPKRSRDTGEIVGYGLATIIDYSVFTPGRLVFCGRPEVL